MSSVLKSEKRLENSVLKKLRSKKPLVERPLKKWKMDGQILTPSLNKSQLKLESQTNSCTNCCKINSERMQPETVVTFLMDSHVLMMMPNTASWRNPLSLMMMVNPLRTTMMMIQMSSLISQSTLKSMRFSPVALLSLMEMIRLLLTALWNSLKRKLQELTTMPPTWSVDF